MINLSEVNALIILLDDEDVVVYEHVQSKLISYGSAIIPILLQEIKAVTNPIQKERIFEIIRHLQFKLVRDELKQWYESQEQDLLTGICIVAKYKYPEIDKQQIANEIDKIRLEIWLEMHYDLSPFEKIRIINNTLFSFYKFTGNTDNFHSPDNSYINVVLSKKCGNPILLSIVYILIAQRLQLPVFGVNLPQHFVCAFKEDKQEHSLMDAFNSGTQMDYKKGRVLFYINAYKNGAVFSRSNLEHFLMQMRIEPKSEYFEACSNLQIMKRVLRNLVVAYTKEEKMQEAEDIKEMLLILGENYMGFSDDDSENEL